jgi:hypothetical protein
MQRSCSASPDCPTFAHEPINREAFRQLEYLMSPEKVDLASLRKLVVPFGQVPR